MANTGTGPTKILPRGPGTGGFKRIYAEKKRSKSMNTTPEDLTNAKRLEHGDWMKQSQMVVNLKNSVAEGEMFITLHAYQREAIDMILVKVSRIVTGNPKLADHWDDIAGYAFLGRGGHAEKDDDTGTMAKRLSRPIPPVVTNDRETSQKDKDD